MKKVKIILFTNDSVEKGECRKCPMLGTGGTQPKYCMENKYDCPIQNIERSDEIISN